MIEATLPIPWAMPPLPPGWRVTDARIDREGAYWLGRMPGQDAIAIRLEHAEPLAFAHVALRRLDELRDFLLQLEGMTPFLRHGMHVEVNYY